MAKLTAAIRKHSWLSINVNCLSTSDMLRHSCNECAEDTEDDSNAQSSKADREEGGERQANLRQEMQCNSCTNKQANIERTGNSCTSNKENSAGTVNIVQQLHKEKGNQGLNRQHGATVAQTNRQNLKQKENSCTKVREEQCRNRQHGATVA